MKNPYWDKEITVFTKYYDELSRETKWYKYKCENCFYGLNRGILFKDMTLYNSNKNIARIPERKDYIKYEDWCKLSHEEKQQHFSLNVGSLIFEGYIEDVILDNDSGNNLMNKYRNDCFKINFCTDNNVFKLRHYYASGA